jgi:hypothetical protein
MQLYSSEKGWTRAKGVTSNMVANSTIGWHNTGDIWVPGCKSEEKVMSSYHTNCLAGFCFSYPCYLLSSSSFTLSLGLCTEYATALRILLHMAIGNPIPLGPRCVSCLFCAADDHPCAMITFPCPSYAVSLFPLVVTSEWLRGLPSSMVDILIFRILLCGWTLRHLSRFAACTL